MAWLVLEAVQSAWTVEDVAAVYDELLHRTSIYKWKLQFYYKFHYKCTWLWDRGDSSKGKIRPKFGIGSTRFLLKLPWNCSEMWWNIHYTNGEAILFTFMMLLEPQKKFRRSNFVRIPKRGGTPILNSNLLNIPKK